MKTTALLLVGFALAACATARRPDPAPASPVRAEPGDARPIDLGALAGKEVDLQTLLKLSTAQTGRSFSYDAGIAKRLETSYVTLANPTHMTGAEFDDLFARLLEANGMELVPLGPAELRVFAVQKRPR